MAYSNSISGLGKGSDWKRKKVSLRTFRVSLRASPVFGLRTQALLSGFSSAISRDNTALIACRTSRTQLKATR